MLAYLGPMIMGHVDSFEKVRDTFNHFILVFVPFACVYQLFLGIVQAVSYSLLRADKDGVSNEELAKVFE